MDETYIEKMEAVLDSVADRLNSVEERVNRLGPAARTETSGQAMGSDARTMGSAGRAMGSAGRVSGPDDAGSAVTTEPADAAETLLPFDDGETPGEEHAEAFSIPEHTSVFNLFLQHIVQGFSEELFLSPEQARDRFDAAETPLCTMEFDSTIRYANPALSRMLESEPSRLEGLELQAKVLPEYRGALETRLKELSDNANDTQAASSDDILLFRMETESGERLSIECIVLCWRSRARRGVIAVLRDLQVQQSMLDEYRRAQQDYDTLSETITEAVLRINEAFKIVHANSAVSNTFGYEPAEVLRRSFSMLFPDGEFERHEATFRKYFIVDDHDREEFGLARSIEILGKKRDGSVVPMELTAGNSKQYNERTLTCIIRDISERKTMERRLRSLAYYDKLTGSGNRDLFNTNLRSALAAVTTGNAQSNGDAPPHGSDTQLALLFMDLDGFKQVNDTLGHEAGDQLLIETAGRIRETIRETDTMYRFGGDEFVVLMPSIETEEQAGDTANSLLSAIRMPFRIAGESGTPTTATVGVSIGIAFAPRDATGMEHLVRAADMAMYDAKHRGKNRVSVFSTNMDASNAFRWDLKQGLQGSIERGGFFLHYQPLVDTDGTPEGFEVLLRWDHPTRGRVSPADFVPVAEEAGLMVTLGNWVVQRACHEFVSHPRHAEGGHYLSINVSARQLEHESFPDAVVRAVETSGLDASRLQLELTETSLMSAPEEGIDRLRALKSRLPGMRLLIDDFGTGFSSLSYLSRFPVDTLKIDRSFVIDLSENPDDPNRKIIRAIIGLAHSLDLTVVAEGVENQEQWQFLLEEACDSFQGFHFGGGAPLQTLADQLTAVQPAGGR